MNTLSNVSISNHTRENFFLAIFFLALSITLPLAIHVVGGSVLLLPMQLPLLCAAFLLPFEYATFVVIVAPLISTLLTGRPLWFPGLPLLILESLSYVLIIKYCYQRKQLNIYWSLIAAQLVSRVVVIVSKWVLSSFCGTLFVGAVVGFWHLIIDFFPGLMLQLLIIPVFVQWVLSIRAKDSNA